MKIAETIAANRAVFHTMRDLNVRAGRDVFPIPSREALQAAITTVLGGARRSAEIADMSKLQLPSPDSAKVAEIKARCPDTIDVLGCPAMVEYRISPRAPWVLIRFQGGTEGDWRKLPDEGIYLPDGREVTIAAVIGRYGWSVEAPSSQFKEQAKVRLNRELWEARQLPELSEPTNTIAPIVEQEYGRCVLTNVPLIAYGTVEYISWRGSWRTYWSQDRADTERLREQAVRQFDVAKAQAKQDALRLEISKLYKLHRDHNAISENLRNRMYHAANGYDRQSIEQMEAIIAEVNEALKPEQQPTDLAQIDVTQFFGGTAKG